MQCGPCRVLDVWMCGGIGVRCNTRGARYRDVRCRICGGGDPSVTCGTNRVSLSVFDSINTRDRLQPRRRPRGGPAARRPPPCRAVFRKIVKSSQPPARVAAGKSRGRLACHELSFVSARLDFCSPTTMASTPAPMASTPAPLDSSTLRARRAGRARLVPPLELVPPAGFRKWADRGHFMAALSSSSKGAAGPAGGRDAAHAIEDG